MLTAERPSLNLSQEELKDLTNGMTQPAAQSRINALLEEVEGLRKDAERYRWLREQHWDKNTMCVVTRPKSCVKLGSICPSGDLLDFDIDASLSSGRSGSGESSNV